MLINPSKILLGGLSLHIYTLHCKGGRLKYDSLTSLQCNQVITGINNYKLLTIQSIITGINHYKYMKSASFWEENLNFTKDPYLFS